MRKEKGITLLALVITIVLILILLGATVNYGVNSLNSIKLQNFKYELDQIQGKVDTIYEKIKLGNEEEYILLGSELTDSEEAQNTLNMIKGIDYSNILDSQREKYYYQDQFTYYRYFTQSELQSVFDITSRPGDMIINFKTKEVISVKGFTYDGRTYYTSDEMK